MELAAAVHFVLRRKIFFKILCVFVDIKGQSAYYPFPRLLVFEFQINSIRYQYGANKTERITQIKNLSQSLGFLVPVML